MSVDHARPRSGSDIPPILQRSFHCPRPFTVLHCLHLLPPHLRKSYPCIHQVAAWVAIYPSRSWDYCRCRSLGQERRTEPRMEIVPLSHVAERHWYGAPLYQKRSQEYRMLSILLRRNTVIGERICLGNSGRVQGTYSVKCAPQDTAFS